MKFLNDGNWGLKLLALILAIVIYHVIKNESAPRGRNNPQNDRTIFQSR